MQFKTDEFNTTTNFLGYYNTIKEWKAEDFQLSALMPIKKIVGIDYSYIKGRGGIVATLSPSTFDTEAVIRDRGGFDFARGELAMFKNKMTMKEKQRQDLFNFMQGTNQNAIRTKLAEIFDDQKTLVDSAVTTMEYLRSRALFDGKITMKYDGGIIDVDYGYETDATVMNSQGVPNKNKFDHTEINWASATASVVNDIINLADVAEERTGVRPDSMIMNRKTFRLIKANQEVRGMLKIMRENLLSDMDVMNYIEETTGVRISIYNRKVSTIVGKANAADLKIVDLVENGKILFYPASAGLGNLMVGTSPTEFNKSEISKNADVTVTGEGIAISKWNTIDPIQLFTAVEMVCLPSFPNIDLCISLTVATDAEITEALKPGKAANPITFAEEIKELPDLEASTKAKPKKK